MGLLDSNIARLSTKSFTISGAATTANSYVNGANGLFSTEKYATICFRVKSITSGVKILLKGGVTSSFDTQLIYYNGKIMHQITSTGKYYADISVFKEAGFYIDTGIEGGSVEIDVVMKSTPLPDIPRPIQNIRSETFTLSSGDTYKEMQLRYPYSSELRYFKFITVFAKFKNSSDAAKTKDTVSVYTKAIVEGEAADLEKRKTVESSNNIITDWIPLQCEDYDIRVAFSDAAAEGDKVIIVVKGIR